MADGRVGSSAGKRGGQERSVAYVPRADVVSERKQVIAGSSSDGLRNGVVIR